MGTVGRPIKPNRPNPGTDDPGILPGRQMRRFCNAARKEELLRLQMGGRNPGTDRVPCLLGDLKLHRPLGLPLHNNRASGDMTALYYIVHAKPDQIAPAQLAVDGGVEQRELPGPDDPVAIESGWPRSLLALAGFWPSSLPLFHGVTRPLVV